MNPRTEEQLKIITKGASVVVEQDELAAKIENAEKQGRPLIAKLGLDPSAPDIHLGHTVVLRKIRQIQDLGHRAAIIIGDFTGRIGDPTGKSKTRNALSAEQVAENAVTYQKQIFKIIDESKTDVYFNSQWLAPMNFEDILRLAATTTVARLLERDDFHNRYTSNTPIGLHEFFYPLMQGYDSVQIKADIEIGGTDQTFNILMGRNLQSSYGQERQIALLMPLLEGLDGKEKMSKSLGNYIGVDEPANVMYKKVMEVPDDLIIRYYLLCTDVHPDIIDGIKKDLDAGKNPRDVKFGLAKEITTLYHGEDAAQAAIEYYEAAFSRKSIPDDIPTLEAPAEEQTLAALAQALCAAGYAASTSKLRQLAAQGGIRRGDEKLSSVDDIIRKGDVLRIGKKQFVKII